jgi:RNA polymerase sigma-70 factor (ECF subfamily)
VPNAPPATGAAWFTTTHWSVVLAAGSGASTQSAAALEQLCQAYWRPLYAYIRRRGHSPEDAQDLTQGFFAHLLEKNWVGDADRERGRFRTFLLTAVQRFLSHQRERALAIKRGGQCAFLSLDQLNSEERHQREPSDGWTPEKVFERRYALALLDKALTALRAEYARAGKTSLFEAFQTFLSGEHTHGGSVAAAAQLNMSEGTARVWIHRLRRRYGELLRLEIAQTVATPAEAEEELRHILAVLGE